MIYYISTTGNDANNGSQVSPWKTLKKATSAVTTAGDTIFVNAGTYTETQQCDLAVGVNLEGADRATTILKSSISGDWSTFLNIESGGVTNGNQTISNITFDGQYVSETNYKTWIGVWCTLRSNVTLSNCEIKNFYDRGAIFNGNGDNSSTIPIDPGIYTINNKVIGCVFNNTARNSPNYIAGQLNIGGQMGMEISGNIMIQNQRPAGKNGEIIKYWGSGYNLGCKIINNTLKRMNFSSSNYNGSGDWNFAIELFNNSGMEISGNILQGSIDLNYSRKGAYAYSLWIHNNDSDHSPANTKEENGIVFEFETQDVIVENNKFNNQAIGITFNMRTPTNNGGYNNPMPIGGYSACRNIIIRNNLFTNLYSSYSYGNCCGSAGIQFYTEGDTKDAYVRNLLIENNTFVNRVGNESNNGIDLTHFVNGTSPRADSITISKNIFVGFVDTYLVGGGAKMVNIVTKDNDIWQCGSGNAAQWTGSLTNTGNISVNPNFDANYISSLGIGYQGTGAPPPPTSCTYTYSAWGPCVNGTQTRTIISATPSGCIGTPILSQLCQEEPCTYAYSAWSVCVNGQQTRTVISSTPANCIGTPVLTQSCTVTNTPPIVNAGLDEEKTISMIIIGSATDDDSIATYKWTKVSGPTGLQIVTPTLPTTKLQNLKPGTYVLRLTCKDNKGLIAFDEKTITIKY